MKINEKNLCAFATAPPVDLEGWLTKRGEVNKSWQRRWFVLKGNLLFYFDHRGDREPVGVIILEGCTVELAEEGEQYCFQIIFHGVNNRTYFLSAESQSAMETWMKALTCAGYEYIKLMVSELQRQLAEIEGNHNKAGDQSKSDANFAPKPPPRRQNPFNRPAPGIPTSESPKSNQIPAIPPVLTNPDSKFYIKNETATNVSSGSDGAPNDDRVFMKFHAELGRPIMEEYNERRLKKNAKLGYVQEPLITF